MSIIPVHTVFGLALAGVTWLGRCNQRRRSALCTGSVRSESSDSIR